MTPLDYRNATWQSLQGYLVGMRKDALQAWRLHGPGTTAEIAQKSGMSILTLRPRTTELFDLGFVRLAEGQIRYAGGAVYRVSTGAELAAHLKQKQREHETNQLELLKA